MGKSKKLSNEEYLLLRITIQNNMNRPTGIMLCGMIECILAMMTILGLIILPLEETYLWGGGIVAGVMLTLGFGMVCFFASKLEKCKAKLSRLDESRPTEELDEFIFDK